MYMEEEKQGRVQRIECTRALAFRSVSQEDDVDSSEKCRSLLLRKCRREAVERATTMKFRLPY